MDCRECHNLLDNLLVEEPTPDEREALSEHAQACPACAEQYELALRAVTAITPQRPIPINPRFKERVMLAISEAQSDLIPAGRIERRFPFPRVRAWKLAAALAAAAVLLVALLPLLRSGPDSNGPDSGRQLTSFSLFSAACAAEARLFSGGEIVHLVNEIVVTPVDDPVLAKMRWLPLASLDATGKPQYQQLALGAEPGQGYTVRDESWYDPQTGRYARILTSDDKPIFATAFDGSFVYRLEVSAADKPRVTKQATGQDFRPPQNPAEFLGISTGLRSVLENKEKSLVKDAGTTTLEDGAKAHLLKLGLPTEGAPAQAASGYFLVTIRADNQMIEKMEFMVNEKIMLVMRRGEIQPGESPSMGWDLAGLAEAAAPGAAPAGLGIVDNLIVSDVSIKHMVEKADFTTYAFANIPAWTNGYTIEDVLDLPSPPHRMFVIACRAEDGRHVVMVQSHTYNTLLGPLAKAGKLVYTSPSGIKVWSGPQGQWTARILLQSAEAVLHDSPGEKLTGYLLETPAGTFPALAINGEVSEEELQALIDALVPAENLTDK